MSEILAIPAGIEQLRQSLDERAVPYDDLPMVVLSAGKMDQPTGSNPSHTQRVKVAPKEIANQAALAARSSRGEHRLVSDSGHLIQLEHPEAVITAIMDIVSEIRAKKPVAERPERGGKKQNSGRCLSPLFYRKQRWGDK